MSAFYLWTGGEGVELDPIQKIGRKDYSIREIPPLPFSSTSSASPDELANNRASSISSSSLAPNANPTLDDPSSISASTTPDAPTDAPTESEPLSTTSVFAALYRTTDDLRSKLTEEMKENGLSVKQIGFEKAGEAQKEWDRIRRERRERWEKTKAERSKQSGDGGGEDDKDEEEYDSGDDEPEERDDSTSFSSSQVFTTFMLISLPGDQESDQIVLDFGQAMMEEIGVGIPLTFRFSFRDYFLLNNHAGARAIVSYWLVDDIPDPEDGMTLNMAKKVKYFKGEDAIEVNFRQQSHDG